jgi:hypothetical protein
MTITERIIRESKRQGLSLPKLCEMADVNYQTVWKSVKYGTYLRSDTIDKLIAVMDRDLRFIDLDEMVRGLMDHVNKLETNKK